jgi:hypothetical protein
MNFIMRAPLRCARAYGVRKNLSSVVYGTTPQPSIRYAHLVLNAKVVP